MAEASAKLRKFTAKTGGLGLKQLDKKLEQKGFFPDSNIAEARKESKAAKKKQQEQIGLQRQQIQLQQAEAEDVVGRKRLLRKTGGRQSLIATR